MTRNVVCGIGVKAAPAEPYAETGGVTGIKDSFSPVWKAGFLVKTEDLVC